MNTPLIAYTGADIFDGTTLHPGAALIVRDGKVVQITATVPEGAENRALAGGIIAPGFIDLQVNGGGGVMFNDAPDLGTLDTMATAHATLGTTGFLPTLITDTKDRTEAAIEAVAEAISARIPGILGLHLEGPHLDPVRKGAHDADLIRPMDSRDLASLVAASERLPVLKVTLAPNVVTPAQINTLTKAGIVVSLGHSDADFTTCVAAADAGARCVTHLFNAMSPLASREPGLVGAALSLGTLSTGLICDLIHVHPVSVALAMAAKQGPGAVFLVTDAMATAGSEVASFLLNGREVFRNGNVLTLADGTLAGAHLDLCSALRNIRQASGISIQDALAMVTHIPAGVIGLGHRVGHLAPGRQADFVHLSADLHLITPYRRATPLTL